MTSIFVPNGLIQTPDEQPVMTTTTASTKAMTWKLRADAQSKADRINEAEIAPGVGAAIVSTSQDLYEIRYYDDYGFYHLGTLCLDGIVR